MEYARRGSTGIFKYSEGAAGGCQGMGYVEVYTARIHQLSGAQLRRILLQLYTGQKAADVL